LVGTLILAAGSGWAQDLLEQGLEAQKARNHEQAVELFGQLVKQDPHQPQAWLARAKARADFEKGCTLGHPLCCHELEVLKAEQPATLKQGK
jgi:hypothetical protein